MFVPVKINIRSTMVCTSLHEGRQVIKTTLPIHIDQLFTLLFTNSKFFLDFHTARKTTGNKIIIPLLLFIIKTCMCLKHLDVYLKSFCFQMVLNNSFICCIYVSDCMYNIQSLFFKNIDLER